MRVYRVEQKDHTGPFELLDGEDFAKVVSWAESIPGVGIKTDDEHPHHISDVLKGDEFMNLLLQQFKDYRTGVDNEKLVTHWFPRESWSYFAKQGMGLDTYEVPDDAVIKGKYQVLFDMDRATLISRKEFA